MSALVGTAEEFDRFANDALHELLDRATAHTRKFLKETGQWADDVGHEKLALRWGHDLLERFLVCGRLEVPCRPFFLLDSLAAKFFSQPDPLRYHRGLLTPLGRFLDGLTAKAVVSRDALMALFYHLHGFGQSQVVRILGLDMTDSQRIYKNFERWRRDGWQRTVGEIGFTEIELSNLEDQKSQDAKRFNADAGRLLGEVQTHYRKSEPEHFACLPREQWTDIYRDGHSYDYRVWHLAMCRECLEIVCGLRKDEFPDISAPAVDLHVRPLQKNGMMVEARVNGGNGHGMATRRADSRLS
ncbi:MAG: hypothetical protein HY444_05185 [Nitrospirae bacterium]|nr:hypothetical protein [Nitrospirota bacterium]